MQAAPESPADWRTCPAHVWLFLRSAGLLLQPFLFLPGPPHPSHPLVPQLPALGWGRQG